MMPACKFMKYLNTICIKKKINQNYRYLRSANHVLYIIAKKGRNYCTPFKTNFLTLFSLCTRLRYERIIYVPTIATQMYVASVLSILT
jgi:hypothetical protein